MMNGRLFVCLFTGIISLVFISSCSREQRWTQREFVDLATAFDERIYQVPIPNHEPHRRVICENYGEGCLEGTGRRLMIRQGVELIAISFESQYYAKAEAERLDQYYARNWLFDDVSHEPILIDFIERVYGARPGRTVE